MWKEQVDLSATLGSSGGEAEREQGSCCPTVTSRAQLLAQASHRVDRSFSNPTSGAVETISALSDSW